MDGWNTSFFWGDGLFSGAMSLSCGEFFRKFSTKHLITFDQINVSQTNQSDKQMFFKKNGSIHFWRRNLEAAASTDLLYIIFTIVDFFSFPQFIALVTSH